MNFDFSDDQKQMRDAARKFLSEKCSPKAVRTVLDGKAPYDKELWKGLAEMGFLGVAIPEEFGGAGAGHLELCVIAEEMGRAYAPVPFSSSVYLAAEDPRLVDLERNVLSKLSRTVPRLKVAYAVGSRTGLFERADEHYGEVWYALGDRNVMTHSATEPIVLELLYQLADLTPPLQREEKSFPGYPLAAYPTGAALIYYLLWPMTLALFWGLRRRPATIFFRRKQ